MNYQKLNIEQLYVNLSLISKIEIGNKLLICDNFITVDKSYISFISRWLNNSSRDETIKYISFILKSCFESLENNTCDRNRMLNYLQLCLNGINNLKQTYSDDKLIQAKIDVLIEDINLHKFT